MNYEDDFASEETVNLDVKGYKPGDWKYKPTTGGQENSWLPKYMVYNEEFKMLIQDHGILNKLKLLNITTVPYDKNLIRKRVGVEQEWKQLNEDQKWSIIEKLKGPIFDKLIKAINKIDKQSTTIKNE